MLLCPRCGSQNQTGQPYCQACGTPLMTNCPYCKSNIIPGSRFCGNCGRVLEETTQQRSANNTYAGSQRDGILIYNSSGLGEKTTIPPEIHGWNWGAFFLSWIWGIGNNVWIALIMFIPIPFLAFIMAIVLGVKGNQWAWQKKRWESIEHFQNTQQTWAYWGAGLFVLWIIFIGVFYFLGFVSLWDTIQSSPSIPTIPSIPQLPFDIWHSY